MMKWLREVPQDESAATMKTYPSVIQRWIEGTHRPSAEQLSRFHELFHSKEYAEGLPLYRKQPEWAGRDLSILVPCYKMTNAASAWAWVALALDLGRDSVRMDMELGDAVIENARNKLACRFLETDCQWSLWLDDDIIPPIGREEWFRYMAGPPKDYPSEQAAEHVVHRLMSHGKTMVGGLYFGRQKTGVPMFYEGLAVKEVHMQARNPNNRDLLETDWVATGCLLVHRSVYEDIMEKFPERRMLDPTQARNCGEFDFFRMEKGAGEDVSFCKLAQAAGHKTFVDLGVRAAHVGYCAWSSWNTDNGVK